MVDLEVFVIRTGTRSTVVKAVRSLGAVALVAVALPVVGATPAYAESTSITASTGGYFFAEGIRKPDESPAAPPNVTADRLDRVGPNKLGVAAQAGREDKISFLLFDLLEITPGSMITKATLTLPLVPNDNDNTSYAADPAKVRACMAGPEGFNGDDGTSFQDAPARKCDAFSSKAPAATADGKAYVFDITALAAGWVDGDNDGVAITAAEGATTTPFQIVFAEAEKAVLALDYTPGAEEAELPTFETPTLPGTSGTGTSDGAGFGGGSFVPPPTDSFTAPAPEAPAAAPAPEPGVAPQPETQPAAAAGPTQIEMLRPTTGFWIAGLLLLALLALLALIMGDTSVRTAAGTKPSRLTRALDARRRGGSLPRLTPNPLS